MALGQKLNTGTAGDNGNKWQFFSKCGFTPAKQLTGGDTTEDPATNRLSHYYGGYDIFKVKD